MQVVISVNPHEGMCRLEMKLHGCVLINAISFTNADCFDTSCRPSAAIKQIGFSHAKLKADIRLLFPSEGINARLRACEPAAH